jgi:hypothetical protein
MCEAVRASCGLLTPRWLRLCARRFACEYSEHVVLSFYMVWLSHKCDWHVSLANAQHKRALFM